MRTDTPLDGWTVAQRERILKFHETGDSNVLAAHDTRAGNGGRVGVGTCKQWRDTLREHPERSTTDVESGTWSVSTVRIHVYGRCGHSATQVGAPVGKPAERRCER